MTERRRQVGPVLEAGEVASAILVALRESNQDMVVEDHEAYLRVLVPGRCMLLRDAIERALGRPFALPGDLEHVMPAFKGRLSIDEDRVTWSFVGS